MLCVVLLLPSKCDDHRQIDVAANHGVLGCKVCKRNEKCLNLESIQRHTGMTITMTSGFVVVGTGTLDPDSLVPVVALSFMRSWTMCII